MFKMRAFELSSSILEETFKDNERKRKFSRNNRCLSKGAARIICGCQLKYISIAVICLSKPKVKRHLTKVQISGS